MDTKQPQQQPYTAGGAPQYPQQGYPPQQQGYPPQQQGYPPQQQGYPPQQQGYPPQQHPQAIPMAAPVMVAPQGVNPTVERMRVLRTKRVCCCDMPTAYTVTLGILLALAIISMISNLSYRQSSALIYWLPYSVALGCGLYGANKKVKWAAVVGWVAQGVNAVCTLIGAAVALGFGLVIVLSSRCSDDDDDSSNALCSIGQVFGGILLVAAVIFAVLGGVFCYCFLATSKIGELTDLERRQRRNPRGTEMVAVAQYPAAGGYGQPQPQVQVQVQGHPQYPAAQPGYPPQQGYPQQPYPQAAQPAYPGQQQHPPAAAFHDTKGQTTGPQGY